MPYYMRFIATDGKESSGEQLDTLLKRKDAGYSVSEEADVAYGGELYGLVEFNRPGDGLFEEEIDELRESLDDARGWHKKRVQKVPSRAKEIIADQVLVQGREVIPTMQRLEPLEESLLEARRGLLQFEAEG